MPDAASDCTKRDHGGAHLIEVLGHVLVHGQHHHGGSLRWSWFVGQSEGGKKVYSD